MKILGVKVEKKVINNGVEMSFRLNGIKWAKFIEGKETPELIKQMRFKIEMTIKKLKGFYAQSP